MRVRKFKQGAVIRSMRELQEAFEAQDHIFWDSRPTHRAWMMSMHYHTLLIYVRGHLHRAELTDEWEAIDYETRKVI
jgi:hypothetical protein